MSDAFIKPIPALDPPYYTVVFSSLQTETLSGYGEAARHLGELVKEVPGFLGFESARTPGGIGITVGYFRDEESIDTWRRCLEHQAAQERGRTEWYQAYSVHVGKVERSYSFGQS
ncbi:antibiotic biosynthesis monooxygenase family protein [Streptomyces sp. NPDC057638]|uniref:antibiotic biosynthesis monooxygenase family protein n=1 Tax=Streptomyces sp. NPDC057638 TaxID=3346190 RepID=UPI00369DA40A